MTAEICVINKLGVALGADSAVTIGNGKKYITVPINCLLYLNMLL